ncbi:MAG: YbhB/YbcL family Raf kinase inhibitor-like protein [Anaerolineales bacterium]
MSLTITSSAFEEEGRIPQKYTCEGADVSPPLSWSGVPDDAQSLVLIADDPDAPMGTWVHWVLYDLPPETSELAEGASGVGAEGINDFKRTGYGGPCPPPGSPHRYFFKLYALDTPLNLSPKATKKEVVKAMEGHILAQGQLMGTFSR